MFTFRIHYSIGLEVNMVSVMDREERVRVVNRGHLLRVRGGN